MFTCLFLLRRSEGLSGRALRRIPFLAHALYGKVLVFVQCYVFLPQLSGVFRIESLWCMTLSAVMHGWQQHLLLIIIRINTPGVLFMENNVALCLRFFFFSSGLGLFVFNIKKITFLSWEEIGKTK